MANHSLGLHWSNGSNALNRPVSKDAGLELNVDESIPNASTDLNVAFAIVRAKLKMFYMVADGVLTVETNDGTTPDNTFTLAAGVPIVWYEGIGVAVNTFFAADITSLKITNASGAAVLLQIRALVDPT